MTGRPKKYMDGTITFTYRTDAEQWRMFSVLTTLAGETPTDVFSKTVQAYISEKKHLLTSAAKSLAESE